MPQRVACDIEMSVQISLAKDLFEVVFHSSYGEAVALF